MSVLESTPWSCPRCGVINMLEVDLTSGRHQSFTEDCGTCCSPAVLTITYDLETEEFNIDAEPENL